MAEQVRRLRLHLLLAARELHVVHPFLDQKAQRVVRAHEPRLFRPVTEEHPTTRSRHDPCSILGLPTLSV